MTTTFAPDPFEQTDWHDVAREPRDEDKVERDKRGRPKIHLVDDQGNLLYDGVRNPTPRRRSYTRVTTWAKTLEETTNLSRWAQRMTALGVAERRDLQLGALAARDDKDALNGICEVAKAHAKSNVKRDIGTALHNLTQRLDEGLPLGFVPEEFQADLDAYMAKTQWFEPVMIEKFVVNDEIRTGGTPDRIVRWRPCEDCGADYFIADLKSGNIVYGADSIAIQLGIYANSKIYNPATGERSELPGPLCRCKAVVIWLPPEQGVCELEWFDIEKGWDRAHRLARFVRQHRNDRRWSVPFQPGPTAEQLHRLIQASGSREEVVGLWRQYRQNGWTTAHDDAAALLWPAS